VTGLGAGGVKLSRKRGNCDRFGFWRGKAVKRKANFRQVCHQTKKSCQKKEELQTGLVSNEEKLSKERGTSDRFGVK
jgi:hypothetical protein